MLPARARVAAVAIALLGPPLLAVGCTRASSGPSGRASAAGPLAVGSAAAPDASASAAPSAAEASPEPEGGARDRAEIARMVAATFSKYVDGSDFSFLSAVFAPRVAKYMGLTDVPVADVIRRVRAFYGDKQHISLRVQDGTVSTGEDAHGQTATFLLTTQWTQRPPESARRCGHVDDAMQWRPSSLIEHHASVRVEVTLDASGRFVAYDEQIVPRRMRIQEQGGLLAFSSLPPFPARGADPDAGQTVADGRSVDDLGDEFTCAFSGDEVDVVRRVRLAGQEVWVLASWTWSTGHSYVGEDTLVPER